MKVWANMIAYQVVWLITVWGAGHDYWWLAPLALLPFAGWYLSRTNGVLDAWLMLACVITGLVVESTLALSGLVTYAAAFPFSNAAPVWILCIWAAFSLTLRHSFRYLHHKFLLALLLGAVGAPAAYLGASRGWHAVTFPQGAYPAMLGLGIAWAVALPALLKLAISLESTTLAPSSREQVHVV